jgi:hypothetical protein
VDPYQAAAADFYERQVLPFADKEEGYLVGGTVLFPLCQPSSVATTHAWTSAYSAWHTSGTSIYIFYIYILPELLYIHTRTSGTSINIYFRKYIYIYIYSLAAASHTCWA